MLTGCVQASAAEVRLLERQVNEAEKMHEHRLRLQQQHEELQVGGPGGHCIVWPGAAHFSLLCHGTVLLSCAMILYCYHVPRYRTAIMSHCAVLY